MTVSENQTTRKKEVRTVNMSESARLILGLRAKGWNDTEIADFILWIETGDDQYRPKPKKDE